MPADPLLSEPDPHLEGTTMATELIPAGDTYRSAAFTVVAGTPRKLTLAAGVGGTLPANAVARLYSVNSNGTKTFTGYILDTTSPMRTSLNVVAAGDYELELYASTTDVVVDID